MHFTQQHHVSGRTRLLRAVLAVGLAAVATLAMPSRAEAAWVWTEGHWQWTEQNGSYARNKWCYIEGSWYHFDANGNMEVGWITVGAETYFLRPGGQMTTGFSTIDGNTYYFGTPASSGAMCTGWRWISDAWYYFGDDGVMTVGRRTVDGVNYLFLADGKMSNGSATYEGINYLHNGNGAPVSGWIQEGGSWYLRDGWGALQTGWTFWGGWFYFNADGTMARLAWVDDCYLDESGRMVTTKWVGDRYVGSNGYWNRSKVRSESDEVLVVPASTTPMWGVDVSSHDHTGAPDGHFRDNTEYAYLQSDFVFVKSTQGGGYYNPYFESDMRRAIADNKLVGIYHYAGNQEPEEEADMFYESIKAYVGSVVPVLDWELYQNENNFGKRADWCRRFADRFFDRSGVWCTIYTSASVVMSGQVSNVASTCPLWVAGYPDNRNSFTLPNFPWSVSPWTGYSVWQFSSSNGVTDRNYSQLDRAAWGRLAEVSSESGRWIAVGTDYWYCHHTTLDYTRGDWEKIDGQWYHFNENGWMDRRWLCDDGDWYWLAWDGSRRSNEWVTIDGKDYHFDADGKMEHDKVVDGRLLGSDGAASGRVVVDDAGALTTQAVFGVPGWAIEEGHWRYYNASGERVENAWAPIDGAWYYFGENGNMSKGFFEVDGKLYRADMSGALNTGWQWVNGAWYFADKSGAIKRGWMDENGVWYYFDRPGGEMARDWRYLEDSWYWFDQSGAMYTGWRHNGFGWFYFSEDGTMSEGWDFVDGEWYYFDENGYMATGWQLVDELWYHLAADGTMERDVTVDDCYIGHGGYWVNSEELFVAEWAPRINNYLEGSPLEGYGVNFASAAYRYDVDPRWSPAISCIESGMGRICFRSHNAWGWGTVDWPSWEVAIESHVKGLSQGYGHTLTREGASKYAGGTDAADAWYDAVSAQMELI